jgi:hypothetical protein
VKLIIFALGEIYYYFIAVENEDYQHILQIKDNELTIIINYENNDSNSLLFSCIKN